MHANFLVYITCLIADDRVGDGHCSPCFPLPLVSSHWTWHFCQPQLLCIFCDLSQSLWFCKRFGCCLECFPCQCLAPNFPCSMSPSNPSSGSLLAVQEQVGPLLTLGSHSTVCTPDIALPSSVIWHFCGYISISPPSLKTLTLCFTHLYIPRASDVMDPQYMFAERMN